MNEMKRMEKVNLIIVNAACILVLLAIVTPLLMIARYNYPSADDWSFSVGGYNAVKNGEGILGVLKSSIETTINNRTQWEGRFSIAFLSSLQPGIWGEKYYHVVAWLMLGGLIFSEIFLFISILGKDSERSGRWLALPIIAPSLALQILYSPYPEESFYWYNGSVNYTFVYGMSLILLALFLKMGTAKNPPKWKYGLWAAAACFLAVLVGGNNYATSLSSFLTLLLLSTLFLWRDRKAFCRTWFLTALLGSSLLFCIFSPGSAIRINANFNGETGNPVEAVLMSLVRSFTNIYSWTNLKVILVLLFIIPFVWKAVKNMNFAFRLPGLFTLITFCLYASQATATMYVNGTTGGGRTGCILFYSYHIWMVGNVCYWIGWLCKKRNKLQNALEKIIAKTDSCLLLYCAVIGVVLAGNLYLSDLHTLTSYKAYRNWRQGYAQQYAAEWEARLEVLHDDSIKEVEFAPLSICPEMLTYVDLQDEDGYLWVNDACALYYGKTSVRIIKAPTD
ncbi:MAG: DUF6056 family protein [Roseburia sp.]|nr:DUF6056 family protein [Roseburia sp.]MCM1097286.1 DUF6056 family protein [Ruminococcus flavefaciens]